MNSTDQAYRTRNSDLTHNQIRESDTVHGKSILILTVCGFYPVSSLDIPPDIHRSSSNMTEQNYDVLWKTLCLNTGTCAVLSEAFLKKEYPLSVCMRHH